MKIKSVACGLALHLLVAGTSVAEELRLLAPLATKGALLLLLPEFERLNSAKVAVETATLPQVAQKAMAADAFDVVIAPEPTIGRLVAGIVRSDATTSFGTAHISIAYRKGRSAPRASTLDEVRNTIKAASTIGTTDGGTTAVYFSDIAKRLGLEDELKRKTVFGPSGQGALPVAQGKAEIGVSQSSEIAEFDGLESVKLLPSDPKSKTHFIRAIATKARDPELAARLVTYLASEPTRTIRIRSGFSLD